MKWSKPKRERYSEDYSRTARSKGYKLRIKYYSVRDSFYFFAENDTRLYNSLWDQLSFATEEECIAACEKWVEVQR